MGRHQLIPGVRLLLDEQMYIIREVLADGRCRLENLSLGGQRFINQDELCEAWATGRLCFEVQGHGVYEDPDRPLPISYSQADFQTLPDKQRMAAWARYQHLAALYEHTGHQQWGRLPRRDIQAYVEEAGLPADAPSAASLERWMLMFLDSGRDIRALVPQTRSQGGRGQSRLNPDVERIVQWCWTIVYESRSTAHLTRSIPGLSPRLPPQMPADPQMTHSSPPHEPRSTAAWNRPGSMPY
jgi:hypothetical protein